MNERALSAFDGWCACLAMWRPGFRPASVASLYRSLADVAQSHASCAKTAHLPGVGGVLFAAGGTKSCPLFLLVCLKKRSRSSARRPNFRWTGNVTRNNAGGTSSFSRASSLFFFLFFFFFFYNALHHAGTPFLFVLVALVSSFPPTRQQRVY